MKIDTMKIKKKVKTDIKQYGLSIHHNEPGINDQAESDLI